MKTTLTLETHETEKNTFVATLTMLVPEEMQDPNEVKEGDIPTIEATAAADTEPEAIAGAFDSLAEFFDDLVPKEEETICSGNCEGCQCGEDEDPVE